MRPGHLAHRRAPLPGTLALMLVLCVCAGAQVKPTPQELRSERQWLKRHLLSPVTRRSSDVGPPPHAREPAPGLEVLANHGVVTQNGRGSHPLKIGTTEYSRGLYCHAGSRITVRLPGPGGRFTGVVGLDHNEDTARGKGSVVFAVTVRDKTAFQSEVMRFGTPARAIDVDLAGATSFTLGIGDAGDGIGWDQSDWADARVVLADGREWWLGDQPLHDERSDPGYPPITRLGELPFSFVLGGQGSDTLLAAWPRESTTRRLDADRREHTVRWKDPRTGLEVRCVAVEYDDAPAVEWTVYFRNTGGSDTPLLENIQAIDAFFERDASGEFVLRGNKGDWCVAESFEPWETTLGPKSEHRFAPDGGRPTNGPRGWPYYNIQGPRSGVILAIGWPGQWASTFVRDANRGLRVVAGQQWTHMVLRPGEEIRTPLIAMLFWSGTDAVRAQNLWRRWVLEHNVPRLDGRLPATMLQMQCYRTFEKGGEQDMFDTVNEYAGAGIDFDLCWRDAGWYPCKGSWPNTGTWELDRERYPNGWRRFSDWIHQQGRKFIVWFEPERVGDRESWLARNHPDWVLGGNLLDLGNPDARRWLTDRVDAILRDEGIDYYRQDFNMDPLENWRGHDEPDRRGMTENRHVTGYLAFWDELRRRHPGLLIDSCASGGRRNDLETLRRAVPLLRSDFQFGEAATMPNQGQTHGISSWIPYYGSGCYFNDRYSARSYIMPCSGYAGTSAETRRAYAECRRVAPYMLGDYYPLTPYNIQPTGWIAWQFDRPELGGGVVQAFRREKNDSPRRVFRLRGLVASALYELENLDSPAPLRLRGRELMDVGLAVDLPAPPAAAVILYRKLK